METRRPPLWAWLAIAGAAVIIALGAGVWIVLRNLGGPLPPPDAPWPTTGGAVVYLCGKGNAEAPCKSQAATVQQKRHIQRLLSTMPVVKVVRFESQEEAYRKFKEAFADNKALVEAAQPRDMPETFKAELTDSAHFDQGQLQALPGVAQVRITTTDFWKGRADLGIQLCAEKSSSEKSRCQGRGKATEQEKDAVFEALKNVEGVTAVYQEGRDHAWQNVRRVIGSDIPGGEVYTPEFFHLKLRSPEVQEQVKRVVGQLAGVDYVIDHNKV